MLLIVFHLGRNRYALDTRRVVQVIPWVNFKALPQALPGVAGVIDFHGAPVPLLDLSAMALAQSSRALMSTRIILATYGGKGPGAQLLGLLAEKATETIRRTEDDFADPGVATDGAPYLGPVTSDEQGLIQRVEIERLLSAEVRDVLFRQPLET